MPATASLPRPLRAVWVALLLFALRGARQPALTMSVLVALSSLSLIFQVAQRSAPLESGFFLLGARAWELLMGGLASLALQGRGSNGTRRALSLLGVALILGSAFGLALLRRHVNQAGPAVAAGRDGDGAAVLTMSRVGAPDAPGIPVEIR